MMTKQLNNIVQSRFSHCTWDALLAASLLVLFAAKAAVLHVGGLSIYIKLCLNYSQMLEKIFALRPITLEGNMMPGNISVRVKSNTGSVAQHVSFPLTLLLYHVASSLLGCALWPHCGETIKLCRHSLFSLSTMGKRQHFYCCSHNKTCVPSISSPPVDHHALQNYLHTYKSGF